jgi:D-glycero-alpha-D-manno-heptose-7-phosphate kinase
MNGMIYGARAPLRLGLAGGGTDVPPYCHDYGGSIVNSTISLHARAFVSANNASEVITMQPDRGMNFQYSLDLPLPITNEDHLLTATYNYLFDLAGLKEALPCAIITLLAVPPGSGLGSSSTLVVSLVGAISAWLGLSLGPYDIARTAFRIEREYLGLSGGYQDQYAATFGGFNLAEFGPGDRVTINPINLSGPLINELESRLILFDIGTSRFSSKIIDEQINNLKKNVRQPFEALDEMKKQALRLKEVFLCGQIDMLGQIFNEGWLQKKRLARSITNSKIDEILEAVMSAGATGGKISGAGGGGFMMVYVNENKIFAVTKTLLDLGIRAVPFCFVDRGLQTWCGKTYY